eukprot:CAMPEP_0170527232 /NCGR_PEP_ID=MMETSP0209-20121228/12697_1 /TAXON_ID=665100 ORGANISM="Litonotus pictus, Strain P1" /NCGR_SAMPLE_ID=MMETSP0209 /ASSEMBLY_ACC=CAM_ASM_000301 /LENGTH=657 /DNA_ID=CAMNT_0010817625 /DNA_START=442 /DNA_END=2415 /DNA_ORIENTATION=+
MKIIDKRKVKNNLSIIKQEINCHLSFGHKNIIKLYSSSETKDFFYLAMEYAEHGNVFNEVKKYGKLDERTSRNYFAQVCEAVNYLHLKGYVHRDIKPENILIDSQKSLKLCDFGGAVLMNENEERKTFFGTYEYMAPEIIEGNKYNSGVDIWALGILLYEFLHGYSPFRITDKKKDIKEIYQIYENIIVNNGDLSFDNNLSPEVIDLIKLLLTKDKAKRVSCEAVLLHPWILNKKIDTSNENMTPSTKSNSIKEREDPKIKEIDLPHLKSKVISKKKESNAEDLNRSDLNVSMSNTDNNNENFFDKVLNQVKKKNTIKKKRKNDDQNTSSVDVPEDSRERSPSNKNNIEQTINEQLKYKLNTPVTSDQKNHSKKELALGIVQEKQNELKKELELIDEKMKQQKMKKQCFLDKSKNIRNEISRPSEIKARNAIEKMQAEESVSSYDRLYSKDWRTNKPEQSHSGYPSNFAYNTNQDLCGADMNLDSLREEKNKQKQINSNNVNLHFLVKEKGEKSKDKMKSVKTIKQLNSGVINSMLHNEKSPLKDYIYQDSRLADHTMNNKKMDMNKSYNVNNIGMSEKKRTLSHIKKCKAPLSQSHVIETGDFDFDQDFEDETILDVLENVNYTKAYAYDEKKHKMNGFEKFFHDMFKPFRCGADN